MNQAAWIDAMNDARACGLAGVVLSFNTSDRVFTPDHGAMNLRYFLAARFEGEGLQVWYYSLSSGLMHLRPPQSRQRPDTRLEKLSGTTNTRALFNAAAAVLRDPAARCVLVVDYAGHLVPGLGQTTAAGLPADQLAPVEMLHAWSLDDDVKQSGNFIVLIDHQGALNPLVEREGGFRQIRVELPDAATRLAFTRELSHAGADPRAGLGRLAEGFPPESFARVTNGLRLADIEELFRQCGAHREPVTGERVREKKKQTIAQLGGGLLEVAEPSEGFAAVAGCAHAKSYFQAIRGLWGRGHRSLPQAVLLSGVPGAGKSFLIRAIARELDCPCLVMRGVREMWVGQSERNLDRVLHVVDSMAPCILWTDEIDQTLGGERSGGTGGDSGTNQRMLGRLLEFFGDSRIRGRVLWIATTNRPDLLDVAMKDRFSIKIPFLHPNAQERAALLPVLAGQVERRFAPGTDFDALARMPELSLMTVRALQEVVVWAGTLADIEAGGEAGAIAPAHILRAIADYKPTFDPVEHELIALISLQMTSFKSLLPWNGLGGQAEESGALPPYLDGLVDPQNGDLIPGAVAKRVREIMAQRAVARA